jgi:hypothetical protein
MTAVPKDLCRNVQESMLDGHKGDVSYNLYLSSAGILLVSFCDTCQKYVEHMSAPALLCMTL